MKTVKLLSPDEQNEIDPTGKGRAKIASYVDGRPTIPTRLSARWTPDEWFSRYSALRSNTLKNRPIALAWDSEWDRKYVPQGGTFSLEELLTHYECSFELADRALTFCDELVLARDMLIRMLHNREAVVRIDRYSPGKNTFGGLPSCARKGSFRSLTTDPWWGWMHPRPNLPGERNQRGKHRGINMDSEANVAYLTPSLDAVRKCLSTYLPEFFWTWENPTLRLQPEITSALSRNYRFFGTDFKGCDEHFSLSMSLQLILPIYESLLPEAEYWHFAAAVEEMFSQPLFLGDRMWCGTHNAFSGVSFVSDFETIFDVLLAIAACARCNVPISAVRVFAIGDDLLLAVARKYAQRMSMDVLIDIAGTAGMAMEPEKCSVTDGYCNFTKRLYESRGTRAYNLYGREYIVGHYPGSLTLLNLVMPERRSLTYLEEVVACVQRTDNFFGAPHWAPFVDWFWNKASDAKTTVTSTASDVLDDAYQPDWWDYVYGERWSITSSPTYLRLIT